MSTSDGSTADYYELPAGATELQDLISHRDMNAQIGEVFRACYRYGIVSHSGKLRDAKKIRFYAEAEVKRLESLLAQAKVDGCCATELQHPAGGFTYHFEPMTPPSSFGQQNMIDPADVEIDSAIDDDSERMQAIGQNGNGGEHYGAPDWSKAPDNAVAYVDWTGSAARLASAFYSDGGDRFHRLDDGIPTHQYVLKLDDGRMDIDYPYFMRPAK